MWTSELNISYGKKNRSQPEGGREDQSFPLRNYLITWTGVRTDPFYIPKSIFFSMASPIQKFVHLD
jgi:hypothetical protein